MVYRGYAASSSLQVTSKHPAATSSCDNGLLSLSLSIFLSLSHTHAHIQATHDDAVQNRTYLRLETEAEESRQNLEEFKLKREKERTKLSELVSLSGRQCFIVSVCVCVCVCVICYFHFLEQEMEKKNQEHSQELDSLRQKSSIDKKSLEHNAKLKKQQAEVSNLAPFTVVDCARRGASDGVWLKSVV